MSTAQHSTTRTSADNAFFVVFNLIFFFFIFLHFIFSCFSKRVRCCVWPVCDMHTYILLACVSKVQIHHHHHHHHLQFDAMASEFAHENDKRSQSQNTSVRTSNGCEKLSEKKHACILRCERPAARVQCWAFFLHIEATATVWNGAMVEARSWSTHDLCNHWPHTHTRSAHSTNDAQYSSGGQWSRLDHPSRGAYQFLHNDCSFLMHHCIIIVITILQAVADGAQRMQKYMIRSK